MSTADKIEHPYYNRIIELCKTKIENEFETHGNTWKNNHKTHYWNIMFDAQVKKIIGSKGYHRIYQSIDLINYLLFDISNQLDYDELKAKMNEE